MLRRIIGLIIVLVSINLHAIDIEDIDFSKYYGVVCRGGINSKDYNKPWHEGFCAFRCYYSKGVFEFLMGDIRNPEPPYKSFSVPYSDVTPIIVDGKIKGLEVNFRGENYKIFKAHDETNSFEIRIGDPYGTVYTMNLGKIEFYEPDKAGPSVEEANESPLAYGFYDVYDFDSYMFFHGANIVYNHWLDYISQIVKTKTSVQPNKPKTQEFTYGEISFHGYIWEWNDYYGKSHDRDNGTFTLEVRRKNHYLGAEFNKYVTNLTETRKSCHRWSTKKGKIKINLPKGVKINKIDEIICWERNGSNGEKSVVLFIWTPSSGVIQCVHTSGKYWNGRWQEDIYYFRTTDAAAWSKIQPVLMRELPYVATRID